MRKAGFMKLAVAFMAASLAFPVNALAGEWKRDGNKWNYYREDGQAVKNSWIQDFDGRWFFMDDQGAMKTGWHLDQTGRWYYLHGDGSMAAGWTYLNEKWYYLNIPGGELLADTITPDGYEVDANGAWTGAPANQVPLGAYGSDGSDSSDDSGSRNNNGSNSGGNSGGTGGSNNGNNNGNNENNNGNGNGENQNPWAENHPLDLEATGIVSVAGIPFAVITFKGRSADYEGCRFYLAGHEPASGFTPVTQSGDVLKIPLLDHDGCTLKVISPDGGQVIIDLKEMGDSVVTDQEVTGENPVQTKELPKLVLTKETLPLEQYLKFIWVGQNLYVKPSRTTVNPVQTLSVDALSSATKAPPESLEGKEEEAAIAVLFDLVVNHTIAGLAGKPGSTTDEFLDKWAALDKTIALNSDFTMCLSGEDYSGLAWQKTQHGELPRYVKYLTEMSNYGTKIEFLTGKTDNTNPPELAIETTLKGQDAVIRLSEENETWYRSIAEIKIPYSEKDTFYYQNNHTLSADGRTITLSAAGDGVGGPMRYAGQYQVIFQSYDFADTHGILNVVSEAPEFTVSWDDINQELKLRASFSYYTGNVEIAVVNGETLTAAQLRSDYNNLYIPYTYLANGSNRIELQAAGYEDAGLNVEAPEGFVVPKRSPGVTAEAVLAKTASPIQCTVDMREGAAEWLEALELSHIKMKSRYGSTLNDLNLVKTADGFTITARTTALSEYDEYTVTIEIPGYEVRTLKIVPVKEAPPVTAAWMANFSLKLESSSSSYLSSTVNKVVIDGRTLTKGQSADYAAEYGEGMEIYAQAFTAGGDYTVELHAPGCEVKKISVKAPDDLIQPKPVPDSSIPDAGIGEDVMVILSGGDTGWLGAVTEVLVKRTYGNAAICGFEAAGEKLKLDTSMFSSAGTYNVTIKATGYRTAEFPVTILKTAAADARINYDTERLEVEITNDSSFSSSVSVSVNGQAIEKGKGFTTSGYTKIYIDAVLLTEETNEIILSNPGYKDISLLVELYAAAMDAPELTVEPVTAGDAVIILTGDGMDKAWLDGLGENEITVKYSYSSTLRIDEIVKTEGRIELWLNNKVSSTGEHTITVAIPGYRTFTASFKPYKAAPQVTENWLEDGNLMLTTETYNYFNAGYLTVYLDGEKLENEEQYELANNYFCTIDGDLFTGGEHVIRLEYSGTANYAPQEIEVYADPAGGASRTGVITVEPGISGPPAQDAELNQELTEDEAGKDTETDTKDDTGKNPEPVTEDEAGKNPETEMEDEAGKNPEPESEDEAGKNPETEHETESGTEASDEAEWDSGTKSGDDDQQQSQGHEDVPETENDDETVIPGT